MGDNTLFTLDTLYKINSIDTMVKVSVSVEHDESWTYDDIGDGEDFQQVVRLIESSQLAVCVLVVKASALGVSGSDVLGHVYYKDRSDIDQTLADHSMIANACADLETQLIDLANTLKPYASKGA